jgi:hypothetical protein
MDSIAEQRLDFLPIAANSKKRSKKRLTRTTGRR